jgi:hypothetical protein
VAKYKMPNKAAILIFLSTTLFAMQCKEILPLFGGLFKFALYICWQQEFAIQMNNLYVFFIFFGGLKSVAYVAFF